MIKTQKLLYGTGRVAGWQAGRVQAHSGQQRATGRELKAGSGAEPTALEEGGMCQKSEVWERTGQFTKAEMNRNKES